MQPLRPGQKASDLIDKARGALPFKTGPAGAGNLQTARATLKRLNDSEVGATPVGRALRSYIEGRLAAGAGIEPFLDHLYRRAQEELNSHRQWASGLRDMLRRHFAGPIKLIQLRNDVMLPARSRALSSREAWARVAAIADGTHGTSHSSAYPKPEGRDPLLEKEMFPIFNEFERRFGPVFFGVNVKADAAAGLTSGASMGLGGFRHSQGYFKASASVGLGASAEFEAGVELDVSMQVPENARSLTFEVAIGGGAGGTGEFSVSLQPVLGVGWHAKPGLPTLGDTPVKNLIEYARASDYDGLIFDYKFDGVSASFGLGGGFDWSASINVEDQFLLRH